MKKSLLLVGLISAVGVMGLASCGQKNNSSTTLNRSESLSMQAATSLSMLGNVNQPSAKLMMMAKAGKSKEMSDQDKEDVLKILPTLDLMLENSSSFDTKLDTGTFNPVKDDDTVVYNTKEIISFLGIDGKDSSYTLYYNVDLKEEVAPETDPEPNAEENKDTTAPEVEKDKEVVAKAAEEGTKVEVEEKLEGLAFLDADTYYPFISKVEKEIEADESEEERTFKIVTGEDSYIQVKQEHEVEGNEVSNEFKYKVKENGKITLEYSIEIENEDNQLEIEYEIGNVEYELRKEEKDGETIYHVEYENEDKDVEALVSYKKQTDEEGNTTYVEIK